jgi:chemotaxis signal transduction protein
MSEVVKEGAAQSLRGIVIVRIARQYAYLDIKYVRAILKPRNENFSYRNSLTGKACIRYQGGLFPILNFHVSFGRRKHAIGEDARIILIEYEERRGALLAEKVLAIISGELRPTDPGSPESLSSSRPVVLSGQILRNLDLDKVLDQFSSPRPGIELDSARAVKQRRFARKNYFGFVHTRKP